MAPKQANPTTALEAELIGRIRGHGPITMASFMARALYDPTLGYYSQGLNFIPTNNAPHHLGKDFLTGPTLSPLYGATLANWVASMWQQLGFPSSFSLVEAGPGNGALMVALLNALSQHHPACHQAAQVHLVEVSPTLTRQQQQALAQPIRFPPPQWHHSLSSIPANMPIILLANEVLDAFPIDTFFFEKGQWSQQFVDITSHNTLTTITRPRRHSPLLPSNWTPAPTGAVLEVSPLRDAWLGSLASLLKQAQGAALLIDYGAANLPPQGAQTLQALHQHQAVSIFHRPGQTDLTSHINFADITSQLSAFHPQLTDLSPFLLSQHILRLAEPYIHNQTTQSALHRLLHPTHMGSLFKVLQIHTS